MKGYKVWLGENSTEEQFREIIKLFEQLGYDVQTSKGWNEHRLSTEKLPHNDCIYANTNGLVEIHYHKESFNRKDLKLITVEQLSTMCNNINLLKICLN